MDATGPGVRDTQVFYLRAGAADGRRDPESGQDVERLGLEYWQDAEEDGEGSTRVWDRGNQHERDGRQG